MSLLLLLLVLVRLVHSHVIRVELNPSQSDASARLFQDALDSASPEHVVELSMVSEGWVAVRDGPFHANGSVTITTDPMSPFQPSFDCLGRSGLLIANVSHVTSSTVSLSGIRVRNGRNELGGSLQLLADSVRLQDITISASTATMEFKSDQYCSLWPPPDECLSGGGAVFVQATSVSMDGVCAHNVSTPLSGGAISIIDAQTVHLSNIFVRNARSGAFGGAIAVSGLPRLSHHGLKWTIRNVTATNTEAGQGGGALSLSALRDVSHSMWSVAQVTATNTTAGYNGGAVSLGATNEVRNSAWSVARVTATHTTASINGGAVSLSATSDVVNSAWSVTHVAARHTTASDVAGGAVSLLANSGVSNSSLSVAHVTARHTTAGGGGGAVYLQAYDDVLNSTWSVAHVAASVTASSEEGGAVSFNAQGDVLCSAWTVTDVVVTNARAGGAGGALSLMANNHVASSTWSVARLTTTNARANHGGGGAVSAIAYNTVKNSTWSFAHVTATDVTATGDGGAVFLSAFSDVLNSTWSVANLAVVGAESRGAGSAVAFKANSDVSSSSWSVEQVSSANTTACEKGGAIFLEAYGEVRQSLWSVTHVIATNATTSGYGGAVYLLANNAVSGSTWSVTHVTAIQVKAKRGGVLALKATRILDSTCSLASLQMKSSSATAEGGGVYMSIQSAQRTKVLLMDWRVTDLFAREGAVGVVSHTNPASGERDGLHVVARRFQVVGARAKQSSGVLAFRSGLPYQIPWRNCNGLQFCPFTSYTTSEVPLVYAVRVSASDWDVAGVSATSGALVTLNNAEASFANLRVRHVNVASSGGLWSLSGYTALSVDNMSATIRRASASAQGLLLDHSDSPGNLSLSNVSARLEDGPLLDSGTQTWLHAGALTPAALSSVSIQCPMGATLHNASLGRIHLTLSSFTVSVYTLSRKRRHELVAREFPYSTTSLGCRVCPEGKYMLARIAWVSSDVAGAECPADLNANVTIPLCCNAPWHKRSCAECPTGAVCHGGAHVLAQFGYACSLSSCQQRFDSCAGNRTGFACGHCEGSFGEVIGSVECGADAECRDWEHYTAWVAFPLGCVAAAALFLHSADATSDGVSSGLATILFVLFQSEAIIRTHDESKASTLSHWSMFQISLPAARVCLWPGMSARAKALVPLGSYGAILAALGLFYGAHWLLHRRRRLAHPPSSRRYRRALVSVLLVSYSAIANVCFELVTRTEIDGMWYQSLTGERWMSTADQWAALAWLVTSTVPTPLWFWYGLAHLRVGTMSDVTFGLGLLFPAPAALWPWLMRRWPATRDEKQAARDLHRSLAVPYGEGFWYWDGVFLAQRLAFGLISVSLASNLVYRACAMALLSFVLVPTYVHLHVFASPAVNAVHSVALAGLLVVCFSNGLSAYTYQHGYFATRDVLVVHKLSAWSLWAVPMVASAVKLRQWWKESGAKNRKHGDWSVMRILRRLPTRKMDPALSVALIECSERQG